MIPSIVREAGRRFGDADALVAPAAALRGDRGARGGARAGLEKAPDRPAVIVLTSGTTGTPRGAVFCERQLAAIASIDSDGTWGGGGSMLASTELPHIGFMTKL